MSAPEEESNNLPSVKSESPTTTDKSSPELRT